MNIKLCICLLMILTSAIGVEHSLKWQKVDCTYHKNIESLFEHCSPFEQEFIDEARKNVGKLIG